MKPLKVFCPLVILLLFLVSCHSNPEDNIVLTIKSYAGPCKYTFTIDGQKLRADSWTVSYANHVGNVAKYDTVTYRQESELGPNNSLLIQRLVKKIQSKKIIENVFGDCYLFTFEVYLNGNLIRRTTNSYEEIYSMLDIILLYVNPEDILCDDFFPMYKEMQKARGSKK